MAFIRIAPAVAAKLFGPKGLRFTIGNDEATAKALERWGGEHVPCAVDSIVVDKRLSIVTTPAYMLAKRVSEARAGISKLVEALLATDKRRAGAECSMRSKAPPLRVVS